VVLLVVGLGVRHRVGVSGALLLRVWVWVGVGLDSTAEAVDLMTVLLVEKA
jgi:hypothetical protein